MQLNKNIITALLLLTSTCIWGQSNVDSNLSSAEKVKDIEIDFLSGYYEQDGSHSGVTGGLGTQELTDQSNVIQVNIPINKHNKLFISSGVDFYSSASSDNIDIVFNDDNQAIERVDGSWVPATDWQKTSASSNDVHGYQVLKFTHSSDDERRMYSSFLGHSTEWDYVSYSVGLSYVQLSEDKNREFGSTASIFFDHWRTLDDEGKETGNLNRLYPLIRNNPTYYIRDGVTEYADSQIRRNANLSFTLAQVINKKLQVSATLDLTYQTGQIATPFHRVYFNDGEDIINNKMVRIEKFPNARLKIPVGIRANYYLSDLIVLRGFYRYYYDTYGVTSNTIEIETPVKLNPFISISPFYRFYTQQGSKYFAEFGQHNVSAEYYTSDWDLGTFNSQKVGLGLRYSPVMGIARIKTPFKNRKIFMFKELNIRGGYYWKDDFLTNNDMDFQWENHENFKAWFISGNIKFTL